MKIRFSPNYPEWAASSRLRIYTLQKALVKLGYDAQIGVDFDADVMEFQKQRGILPSVLACKNKVIYDFDDVEVNDVVETLRDTKAHFTTDTYWHKIDSPVPELTIVIPDPIDFCPERPLPLSTGEGLVWFGHETSWPCIEQWVKQCTKSGIKVRAISRPVIEESVRACGAEFVKWDSATFPDELRRSRAMIASHYGSNRGKSNNRAIMALTYGLPCILSDTPAFTELAYNVNHITNAPVLIQWQEIDPELVQFHLKRDFDLEKAQRVVLEHYHPESVALQWLKMVEGL